MNYVNIVNVIFSTLFGIMGVFSFHFIIFAIVGLFARRKFPKSDTQGNYGILISARNEENVIGNLIKSIQSNDYPQDKLHIFVIAHNCTDNTAGVARDLGATVYEYNNPNEKTKGYALKHLVQCINEDYGTQNYDGFFVFDADNILNKNYFEKMNDAFMARNKECVITSFRNSKNFGSNIMSGLYGIYFMTGCRFEMRGRAILNCSSRVSGTGFLFNSDVIKDGWDYVTLTEDWELTADQVIEKSKIIYCDEAELFDEQPTTFGVMWRQRLRWSKGHLLVCLTRFKDLIKSIFSTKNKHKISLYDCTMNIIPFCLILIGISIVQIIMLMFAPLAGVDMWTSLKTWLIFFGSACLSTYITLFVQGIILFIAERKRIHGVSFWKKVLLLFLWPLFLMVQFVIDVHALFCRNLSWKTIPHTDTTTIEAITGEDNQSTEESTEI